MIFALLKFLEKLRNEWGANEKKHYHTKIFLLLVLLTLVCTAGWRIAWGKFHADETAAGFPQELQMENTSGSADGKTAPAKKTPPPGDYVKASDDFNNIQLADASKPLYDIYTLDERRQKGLPVELPALTPYMMPNIAYLTFDDGPDDKNTVAILDILKKNNIHATFYVIGKMAEKHPDVLKRIFAEGHAIGNHSYSHDYKTLYPNKENFLAEIKHTDDIIYGLLGVRPLIIRAPGGAASMFVDGYRQMLKENGYVNHDWNVSDEDATGTNIPAQRLIGSVSYTLANRPKDRGAIVLMHCSSGKETTVEALPQIIEMLKGAGFSFGVVTPMTPQPW